MRTRAAGAVVATLLLAAPALAQTPTPTAAERRGPASGGAILCSSLVRGADLLTSARFAEDGRGRDTTTVDLTALGPAGSAPAGVSFPTSAGCPSAAADATGAVLATWRLDGTVSPSEDGRVAVGIRAADGTARSPALVGSTGDDRTLSRPDAALRPDGSGLVTWLAQDGRRTFLRAARVTTSGDHAVASVLAKATTGTQDDDVVAPAVALDPTGAALVVATLDERSLTTLLLRPDGTASTGAPLPVRGELDQLTAAALPTGEVAVAWVDSAGVSVASGSVTGGLGPAVRVGGRTGGGASIAVAPGGRVLVGWTAGTDSDGVGDTRVLVAARPGADAPFARPQVLAGVKPGDDAGAITVALAEDGRGLAAWLQSVARPDRRALPAALVASAAPGAAFGAPQRVSGTARVLDPPLPAFSAATGEPQVVLVDAGIISGGDFGFPFDSRISVVRFAPEVSGTARDTVAPKIRLSARDQRFTRRQGSSGGVVAARVGCSEDCDVHVFAIVRGQAGPSSGLFPAYRRLRAGATATLRQARATSFDDAGAFREGRTTTVDVVVHASDASGNVSRARKRIRVQVPRSREEDF